MTAMMRVRSFACCVTLIRTKALPWPALSHTPRACRTKRPSRPDQPSCRSSGERKTRDPKRQQQRNRHTKWLLESRLLFCFVRYILSCPPAETNDVRRQRRGTARRGAFGRPGDPCRRQQWTLLPARRLCRSQPARYKGIHMWPLSKLSGPACPLQPSIQGARTEEDTGHRVPLPCRRCQELLPCVEVSSPSGASSLLARPKYVSLLGHLDPQ